MKKILMLIAVSIVWLAPAAGPDETKLVKVRLGPNVNSPGRECSPIISPDGTTLYFVREAYVNPEVLALKERLANIKDEQEAKELLQKLASIMTPDRTPLSNQSSWSSQRQPDGGWADARLLPQPLNNKAGSFILGALPDNNSLFMAMMNEKSADFFKGRNLVGLTQRTLTGWSDVHHFVLDGYANDSPRVHFALAPDNRALLLSIRNSESLGGLDIYVSFIQPNGTWSSPKNLGPKVNTAFEETSLSIAPDDATVYFTSNRPGGLGGLDLYMMRRLDDSWLAWTAPQNLGPEVNSSEHQSQLAVDATGRYAFIAEGPLFREDIFQFALPESFRPLPVVLVRGTVRDPSGKLLAAGIGYERLRDVAAIGAANSDPLSGRYQIALPLGEKYGFSAGAPGYYSLSENLDLTRVKAGDIVERDLLLIPIKPGATIRLNNIFFEFAKAILLPESEVELDRLVGILNQYPKMEIEVAGHTDNVGDDASNLKLSQDRAAAVVKYLLDHGVAAARLRSRGYGESAPVAPNDTDEHRQLNRRVEFVILKIE